ncbi:MAG: hypothetical protein RJA57_322 [Bacteroidota bacterium]|jgi:hypothetical protein
MYPLLFPLFSLLFLHSPGQPRYQKGFVVTASGDTLRGQVYWKRNSTLNDRLFFLSAAGREYQYEWKELRAASSADDDQYMQVVTLRRALEYVEPRDYTIQLQDSTAVQTLPLTRIYKGRRLSLYVYYEKAPFYFLYDGKNMIQLVQKYRYYSQVERLYDYEKGPRIHTTDLYKGVLSGYYEFDEDRKMRYLLENALYDERYLTVLIDKMNDRML